MENSAVKNTVTTHVEEAESVDSKPMRQHGVVVHNDEEHSVPFVIDVLQKVCHLNQEQAIEATLKIHNEGQAVVYVNSLEVCELKADQISTFRDALAIAHGKDSTGLATSVIPV